MYKKLLRFMIAGLLLCLSAVVYADNRSAAQMQQIAASCLLQKSGSKSLVAPSGSIQQLATSATLKIAEPAEASDNDYFYVYGRKSGGFVIVSGDDDFPEVLGYSDNSLFPADGELSCNVRYWLGEYVNQMKAYKENPQAFQSNAPTVAMAPARENVTLPVSVDSLLRTTWNQAYPYFNECPTDTKTIKYTDSSGTLQSGTVTCPAYTGCAATAMAQLFYYAVKTNTAWSTSFTTPYTGSSTATFKKSDGTTNCTLDFSTVTFDWNNMLTAYDFRKYYDATKQVYNYYKNAKHEALTYTSDQLGSVAHLMYGCGVALQMKYGMSASSAYDETIATSLYRNFGFDAGVSKVYREYYSNDEWINMMKAELSNARPVEYSGHDHINGGGHSFVVDGYDQDNKFHVNWGWGGYCDGYYAIDALEPGTGGIGAGHGAYNSEQGMVMGIQPPTKNTYSSLWQLEDSIDSYSNSVALGTAITFTLKTMNGRSTTFTGNVGALLCNEAGTVLNELSQTSVTDAVSYTSDYTIPFTLSIPTGKADGKYRIYFGTKATGESAWTFVHPHSGNYNYLNVTVSNGNALITSPVYRLNQSDYYTAPTTDNTVNVELTRSFVAGNWSTICLPFDLSAAQITSIFGSGTRVAQLNSYDSGNGVMNFTSVTAMTAHTPYIIKPAVIASNGIYQFEAALKTGTPLTVTKDNIDMVGNYNGRKTERGTVNTLLTGQYFISGNAFWETTSDAVVLPGFRAYFKSSTGAKISLNVDGESTAVTAVKVDGQPAYGDVYHIDG
jgi:hypothetical protein